MASGLERVGEGCRVSSQIPILLRIGIPALYQEAQVFLDCIMPA
jgi:hypothetical protein